MYRIRIVLEASRPDGLGFEALDLEDPLGPLTGASGTVALFGGEEAGLRAAGHVAEALAAAVAFGSPVSVPVRCQSPLEAYCSEEAVVAVPLLDAGGEPTGDRLLVCSPCGERLWAEGSAGEPWPCESGAAGGECSGLAVELVEAPGYGAAGVVNACGACCAAVRSPAVPAVGR